MVKDLSPVCLNCGFNIKYYDPTWPPLRRRPSPDLSLMNGEMKTIFNIWTEQTFTSLEWINPILHESGVQEKTSVRRENKLPTVWFTVRTDQILLWK